MDDLGFSTEFLAVPEFLGDCVIVKPDVTFRRFVQTKQRLAERRFSTAALSG